MTSPSSAFNHRSLGKLCGHHHDPNWTAQWTNLAIRNGLLLLATLFIFRIEKIFLFQVHLEPLEWLTVFLPEIGTVLFVESFLLIGIFLGGSPTSPYPRWVFYSTHALLYLIAIIEHQFLIKTGTQVDATLITYSARHAEELAGVLGSGFDIRLFIRIIVAGSCFALGLTGEPHKILNKGSLPYFLFGTFILFPVSLLSAQPTGGTGPPFSSKIYFDFFVPYNTNVLAHIEESIFPKRIVSTSRTSLLRDYQATQHRVIDLRVNQGRCCTSLSVGLPELPNSIFC